MKWRSFLAVGAMLPFAAMLANAESLHYTINWQSGLSLGEASLESAHASPPPAATSGPAPEGGWTFKLVLDAALPGYIVRDEYKSKADAKFCSEELERTVQRGSKKSAEKSTFDQEKKKIKRETKGDGGTSEMEAGECAHDALAFLQFVRLELAQGRLVPHQAVYLGSKYDLQVTYVGNDTVRVGDKRIEADQVRVSSHGPKSDFTIEIFFSKNDARTPLMARIPLPLGTFTVELLE